MDKDYRRIRGGDQDDSWSASDLFESYDDFFISNIRIGLPDKERAIMIETNDILYHRTSPPEKKS